MQIKTKRGPRHIRNQRVRDHRYVVTDYTGCSYVTAGKLYQLLTYDRQLECGEIRGDHDCVCYVIMATECAHLHSVGTWQHPIR